MTGRKKLSALALLGLVLLTGCASGTSTPQTAATPPQTASPTTTATPAPQGPKLELTYIGSDGNVYEMGWPNGTPQQWTTKAQPNQVSYSGLVWSPDGSTLAVLRLTGPTSNPTGYALIEFSSTGQVLHTFTLSAAPYNTPFVWSPDGSEIAYRTLTNQIKSNGDIEGRLTILDAQTGATKETLLYDDGGGGCGGGGFTAMVLALENVHHAYLNLDTFAWTPGQQSILVSRGCGNADASLVNLSNQSTTAGGYPAGATYQPGGNTVILGLWSSNNSTTLGLGNDTGMEGRVFLTASFSQTYVTTLGTATWSPDGQSIYVEHNNGIWTMDANGANVHQVVAGATNDSQGIATVQTLPDVSPDGTLLLYLQLHGPNTGIGGTVTYQCYVAQTDGSNITALPQGASFAVWRPVKG
jgi:Tol biopolymer transport system component